MTVRASAQPRRNTRTRLRGETSRRVIATLISTGMVLQPIAASAGPTNGTVVGGNATISTAGNTTTIEQIDARVVIDWDSFDIDAAETVRFEQPTTQAVALNRVLGDLPTNIRGQLLANGHVWIVNRHGVTFHAGSIVNVGGLLATTADITNTDFLAGRNNFTIPGEDGATVINNGSITFGSAGLAGLVAPGAENRGQIAGKLGSVIVAGEKTFAIDFAGDGMFAFEPKGAADFQGRAVNSGSISNGGGYILIAARTASSLVDESISLGGVVAATTAEMKDGRIVLSGGDGLVNVAGTLDASGGAGEKGGSVKVSGGRIDVKSTARVDVSGGAGGGTAEIGGGYKGASMGANLRNAQDTLVQQGASIRADAGETDDGGTVVVWAEGYTGYAGAISATGGAQSGDGGTVEVSGKQTLGFAGTVDATAPNGETGTLLLDPLNINIVNLNDPSAGTSILFGQNPGATTTIDGDFISNAGAAITLQATNDITLNESIAPTDTLQLQAGNDIDVNQAIISTGRVQLDAGNDVNVNALVTTTSSAGVRLSADSNLAPGAAMRNDGIGTVSLGGAAMVVADAILLSGADASVNGSAAINAGASGTVLFANTSGNAVNLGTGGAGFTVDNAELATITARSVQVLSQNEDIRLDSVTTLSEDLILTAGTGNVTYSGASTNIGSLNVTSAGQFAPDATPLPSLSLAAGRSASITVDGDATLTDVSIGTIADAGALTVNAGGNIAVDGVVASTTNLTAPNATTVTVDGLTAGAVTIDAGIAAVTFETVASMLTSLLVSASQSIGQDVEVSVTGATMLNAATDVTLDDAQNDFAGTVSASGTDIRLTDANALALGDVDAGTLTVNASGAITQELVDGDAIDVTGTSSFTTSAAGAGGAIDLDQALNDFGSTVSASGVSVSLADVNAISLGRIVADSGGAASDLTVSAADAISQTADGIIAFGNTMLTAGGDPITLETATNNFIGAVSASGTDVKLRDVDALRLGDIDASELTVNAGGAISQEVVDGDAIDVTGTSSFTTPVAGAGGRIILDETLNDFGGAVSASGVEVSLADTNAIELGRIVADSGGAASDLTVNAGDAITQTADGVVVIGETMLTAAGDPITLQAATNNFFGAVSAAGTDVKLTDVNALRLGDIDAVELTVNAGGAISQQLINGDAIDVTGASSFTTPAAGTDGLITLDQALNDFGGPVSTSGIAVTLTDANAIQLGRVVADSGGADSDLTVNAMGAITQTADGVVVIGDTTLNTTGSVLLAATTNNLMTLSGMAESFTVNETNGFNVAGLTATGGNIDLDSGGSILVNDMTVAQATGTIDLMSTGAGATVGALGNAQILADGNLTLSAANGQVDAAAGTTLRGAAVTLSGQSVATGSVESTVGDVTMTATNSAIDLSGTTTSAAAISVTALDVSVSAALTPGTNATFTNSAGDLTVVGIADAGVDADSNSFDLTDGDIANIMSAEIVVNSLGGDIDVQGVATAANQGLRLDGGDGVATFGALSFTVAPTVLGANGALTATNVGAVTQVAAAPLTVGGATSITTGGMGAEITLDQANALTGMVSADGTNIVLDSTTLNLDDIDADGSFEADAVGALMQTGTGIDVEGTTTLEGSSIALGSGNDFDSDDSGDAVMATASGGVVTLNDVDALVLGDVSATDVVTATAATTLTAENRVSTTAGAINLTATTGAVSLGDIDAPGNLTVNAGTSISQIANDDNVTVAGVTSLTAGLTDPAMGSITLAEDNNFDNDANGGAVSARGTNITLKDLGDIELDDIDATGNLSVTAARDVANGVDATIRQTAASSVLVTGTTALKTSTGGVGSDSITLNNATNDFDRDASGDALTAMTDTGAVTLQDAKTLRLGQSSSGDTFTATAEDSLIVVGNISSANGGINLTANSDATDADVLLIGTGVSVSAPMGPTVLTASGTSDILVGGGASATGNGLTLNPGGMLRDNGLSVGTVTLTSTGGGDFVLPKTNLTALNLVINADGTIRQSADAIVNGILTANTMGDEVLLTDADNQIGTVFADTTTGMAAAADVSVTNSTALMLGTVRAADLTVNVTGAGNGLSQAMGTTVSATGLSTLNAIGSVMLANTGNQLMTLTGMAASFQIDEADGLNTGDLTATAGNIDIDSGGSILANAGTLMQATGTINLTSTGAGASVGSLGNGQIDAEGDLTLSAANGIVSSGAGSRLEGANVSLGAQSVSTGGTVVATSGSVDVDATAGDAVLGGATTAANGSVDIDATGQATLTGGSAGTTLTVDAADVSLQPGAFTAAGGATFTNNAGTSLTRLGADDANPSTFDLSTTDFAQLTNTDVTVNAPGAMFVDTVNTGTAPNVTLNAAAGSVLVTGAATVPGNLTVNSPTISQNGATSLIVDGITDLNAAGQILLTDATNDFKDRVDASAGIIRLRDANSIALGEVASSTGVNELTITAGGPITDTDGQSITVAGLTRLDAGGNDILLDNAAPADAHDFSETSDFRASGGDITVEDKDGIQLGTITTAANADPTIAPDNAGNLNLKTGGAITQMAAATVAGETRIDATGFDVTLNQANDLVGTVNIAGRNIELNAAPTMRPATTLGDIDAAGTLTVTSSEIIDDNGDGMAGEDINVAGATSITAMLVRLDDASNDFIGSVSAIGDVGVFLKDLNDIVLGQISTMGASEINVMAGGPITDTAGQSITSGAGGTASFTAASGNVVLDNELHNLDIVDASGEAIVLTDVDAIQLRTITQANGASVLSVTAGGAISDVDSGAITVAGITRLKTPSDNITIDGPNGSFTGLVVLDADGDDNGAHGDILFSNLQRLVLGTVDAQNATLTTTSTDASGIAAVGVQDIEGIATYQTDDGSIDLSNAGNDFTGAVNARTDQNGGGDERTVKITDVNSVILGDIDAGDLAVAAQGGSITDDGVSGLTGSDVNADGTTSLTATAEVVLDDARTNFDADAGAAADATSAVDAQGTTVSLTDEDAIKLGAVAATALTVDATGSITDTAGAAITVPGNTTLNANGFDIALDNVDTHDFADATPATPNSFSAMGGDVTVDDLDSLQLGTVTTAANTDATIAATTGALNVSAGGDVAQSGIITASGETTIDATGADVTLAQTNQMSGTINIAGRDISLTNGIAGQTTTLGDIDATRNLAVTSAGAIADNGNGADGEDINVAGTTTLAGSSVELNDASNDFIGIVDATGNTGVTLNDKTAISLGSVKTDAVAAVIVTAGGLIEDTAGRIIDTGAAAFTASSGSITLDEDHEFRGAVDATALAGNVTLRDATALTLGTVKTQVFDVAATTALTFGDVMADTLIALAGTDMTDTMGQAVMATTATLTATDGKIELDEAHDFGTATAAAETDLTLNDVNDLTLTSATAAMGNLNVEAGTSLSAKGDVTATMGTASLGTLNGNIAVDGGVTITANGGALSLTPTGGKLVDGAGAQGEAISLVSGGDFVLPATDLSVLDLVISSDGTVKQVLPADVVNDVVVRTSGKDIILDQANTFGTVLADTTKDGAGPAVVSLQDTGALTLDAIIASALTVKTDGLIDDVDDAASTAIRVTGLTDLDAGTGAIKLDNPNHDFGGGVSAKATGSVELADLNDLILSMVSTNGGLSVTAGQDLTVSDAVAVKQPVALTAGRNISVENSVNTDGNALSLTAGANTANTEGGITVTPSGSLTAGDIAMAADQGVSLQNVTGTKLDITKSASVDFAGGTTAITGPLSITSTGNVTDDPSSTLTVTGTSKIDAPGAMIALDSSTNDFGDAVEATGGSVTLRDMNNLTLAKIIADAGVDVKAAQTVTLSDTMADTLKVDGADVAFGDGVTDIEGTLELLATSTVADTDNAELLIGGETSILASGAQVVLDSASNDFMSTVYAVADSLTLKDKNDLTVVDSDVENALNADADGSLTVQDLTAGATTLVADGPTTAARFSVASLDITSGDTITVTHGAATGPLTLAKSAGAGTVDANVTTLSTPSLTVTDLGAVALDRVGRADATVNVTADDITLGVLRARTATLSAKAGDVETADSNAARTISVGRRGAADLAVVAPDIAVTDRLVDVETLTVDASRNVTLTGAANNGAPVKNALRTVSISPTGVGGALTVESSEALNVNRIGAAKVGSADVTGDKDVTADVDSAGNASVTSNGTATETAKLTGKVGGDASAKSMAGNAVIDADVTGKATVDAGQNASLSGTVGMDAEIDARAAITLAETRALTVGGMLDADSGANDAAGGSITDVSSVNVTGATILNANIASDIVLDNDANDFATAGGVNVSDAQNVTLTDADGLEIADVDNVTGNVEITALSGDLKLRARDADASYQIAPNKRWTLAANSGNVTLDGRIDGLAGMPETGDLTVRAGPDGTIRFKNIVGGRSRLRDVLISGGQNLIFGLRTDADFEMPEDLTDGDFLNQTANRQDIFFVRTLKIEGVTDNILLLIPSGTEFGFDFEDRYYGLSIEDANGFEYSGANRIDLFGEIGGIRSRATGLSPVGPRSGSSEFNNCLIGDPNSCSALTQANVLRLVDLTPDNVFVLDPDQVEQLFLSFGNEELWGLPSVFSTDIADDDEDDEDDSSEGSQ